MYDNSNTKWFSQVLMTYKDKAYATEGYLRVSLSTNTEDFKYFNPPTLNISISNNYQKSINLNIQNAKDLLRAFKTVLSQLNGNELNVQRKYQKDTVLHFTFKVDPNNNQRIVVIEIRNNESDFTKIVIPLESVFESFASCIREFTEQYMSICSQLFIQSIQSETVQIIHNLPNLVKGISSQIVSQIPADETISDSRAPEVEVEEVAKSQATINDLDQFLGNAMDSIEIPELDAVEADKVTKVESLFVKYFIDGDLKNLESLMTNYFMSPSPLLAMASDLKSKIGGQVKDENFTTLPGISDDDLKSLVYISKLFPTLTYQNYLNNNVPVPSTSPVLKYNAVDYSDENLNIAYDLFLFNLYIRTMRRRLENKIEDAINNKALFNIQLRCFTDPFVFSFIDKIDKTKLVSIVLTRYKYYKSVGVFDSYITLVAENGVPEITESDISSVVEEAVDKVVGKSPYIDNLHANLEDPNSLRVTSKNTFSLEQITNEILPLEIAEKTGKDLKNEAIISELKQNHNISDEIIKLFLNKKKKTQTKKESVTKHSASNLERLIRTQFIDEVPEQYRESFMKHITELGSDKFDLENTDFPIDEFGDNVIKSLYLWDPESDPVVAKNYKQFYLKVEQEIMERDLILAKVKTKEKIESNTGGGDWDFLSQ
jgi:hypothetical protein